MPKLQVSNSAYAMRNNHSDEDLWHPWIAGTVGMVAGGMAVATYHVYCILTKTGVRHTTGSLEVDMSIGCLVGAVAFVSFAVLRNQIGRRG